jgi:methionyl-tRNA synthetase
LEANAPWKLVKSDKDAARAVLFNALEPLRAATVLLKPFLPQSTETVYRTFNFATPWEQVSYSDAAAPAASREDLRVLAELDAKGNVKPLFPRIG